MMPCHHDYCLKHREFNNSNHDDMASLVLDYRYRCVGDGGDDTDPIRVKHRK